MRWSFQNINRQIEDMRVNLCGENVDSNKLDHFEFEKKLEKYKMIQTRKYTFYVVILPNWLKILPTHTLLNIWPIVNFINILQAAFATIFF